jgi:hypothetical protein
LEAESERGTTIVKRSVFEKIFREMQIIHFRLDDLEKCLSSWSPKPVEISESKLISLPDHLRKTYMFVAAKGECDATIASNNTGRCRALESNYLNQLARMGWLNKRKLSKTTIYYVFQEKSLSELPAKKIAKINTAESRVLGNFRNYFNDQ